MDEGESNSYMETMEKRGRTRLKMLKHIALTNKNPWGSRQLLKRPGVSMAILAWNSRNQVIKKKIWSFLSRRFTIKSSRRKQRTRRGAGRNFAAVGVRSTRCG